MYHVPSDNNSKYVSCFLYARQYLKLFTHTNSLNPQSNCKIDTTYCEPHFTDENNEAFGG